MFAAKPSRIRLGNSSGCGALQPDIGGRLSDYHINIFYSAEDEGYIADIPDLDACSAFGRTPEEALAEVTKAREAWLEAAREAGKPVPPPRYRPVIYQAR
jgi:predicted RNase H-like HicB family nuclease